MLLENFSTITEITSSSGCNQIGDQVSYIRIKNLSLEIPVLEKTGNAFTNKILNMALGGVISKKKDIATIRALDGINLDLGDGDSLALVGHNGAGKSTLLRVIAGLFVPTIGDIEVKGNVSSLLSVGMGMDFELSGYDNIFLMGLLLGMTKNQIRKKLQNIIDFTELGEFINLPVKTYSAGMATRLSFAVATAIEPEILVLDEGIGAGDARFIHKAQDRAKELYRKTNIMVIASHDETLVRSFCNKAILLERGKIVRQGTVDEILTAYNSGPSGFPAGS